MAVAGLDGFRSSPSFLQHLRKEKRKWRASCDTYQVRGCAFSLQKVPKSSGDCGVFLYLFCCVKPGLWIETKFGSPAIPWNELLTTKKGGITVEHYWENKIVHCTRKPNQETHAGLHSAVGDASDCSSRDRKFEFQLGHITFAEIGHEISSTGVWSFFHFRWFNMDNCQLLAKVYAQSTSTKPTQEKCEGKVWVG